MNKPGGCNRPAACQGWLSRDSNTRLPVYCGERLCIPLFSGALSRKREVALIGPFFALIQKVSEHLRRLPTAFRDVRFAVFCRSKGSLDEKGQVLAMSAIFLVAVIAAGALAVDLAMAFAARAEAQRAADSAALAGASSFIDFTNAEAVDSANSRAIDLATANNVLRKQIEPSQVSVWVIPDSQKVRVSVAAEGLPAWFARVLGVFSIDVAAVAAAVASDGGSTNQCVLPFALPDMWKDYDDEEAPPDNIPNGDEAWEFDPGIDEYVRYTGDPDCVWQGCNGTGLGSNFRDAAGGYEGDLGRRIWIKAGPIGKKDDGSGGAAGGMDIMVDPGNFKIWAMPDPDKNCEDPSYGANWTRQNLHVSECNPCDIYVGVDYETEPGNEASLRKPLTDIFDADPSAYWDDGANELVSGFDNPMDSPRVRVVPLWDPNQSIQGRSTYQFNNFAYIFLEGGGGTGYLPGGQTGGAKNDFAIYSRFMGMVPGGSGGPSTGTLVKYLRLVE